MNAIAALHAALPGRVHTDPVARDRAAHDLGRIVSRRPRAVVRPTSADDVATAVRICARHRVRVAVRGSAHTTFGQSQAGGGVVLELGALPIPDDDGDDDTITVSAGETWASVVTRAGTRGRTFAVLPDFLAITVGGTLGHGGIGEASFRAGLQTDHVRALHVVTGAGDRVRCSPTDHPDLFDACRAGLGQCAVLVAAELALVPAPDEVTVHTVRHPDPAALIGAHRALANGEVFGFLQSSIDVAEAGHTFTLKASTAGPHHDPPPGDVVSTRTLSYAGYLGRLVRWEQGMRKLGVWDVPHPWAYLIVPDDQAPAFLTSILGAFNDVRDGRILAYAFARSRSSTPLLCLPDGEHAFLFGLLRNVPPALAYAAVDGNNRLWHTVAAAGGKMYPAGSIPMTPEGWRHQLGDGWHGLKAARDKFDPAGILGRRVFA